MIANDKLARLAGLLYVILLPTTGPAYYSGQLAVAGDAAATLAYLEANRTLFELAIFVGVVGFIDFLLLGLVLHRLFSPVSKPVGSVMVVFVAVSGRFRWRPWPGGSTFFCCSTAPRACPRSQAIS